jgi:hypothetical protein
VANRLRYGEVLRHVGANHRVVSYNLLAPKPRLDAAGQPARFRPARLSVRPIDVHRLLTPYVSVRFYDQLRALAPLILCLVLFQLFILRQTVAESGVIALGVGAVLVGLMLFMEGLKLGLMPFAEMIGTKLPQRSGLAVVLAIAFALGIVATLAEPSIGALQAAGAIVERRNAPVLHALLNGWVTWVVLAICVGVGLAALLGTLRFLYGWSLKPLIYLTMLPTLGLTIYFAADRNLATLLGLAWDTGGITTGPVTVPMVLALGIGITAATGKGTSSLAGFGIVALASILPVTVVLILALVLALGPPPAAVAAASGSISEWLARTPVAETIGGVQAIVPLVGFLALVLWFIVRERLPNARIVVYGLALALAGIILFNLGLTYGLAKLGAQSGAVIPGAFMPIAGAAHSPLFSYGLGVGVALFFAFALGFGATLAEPALITLGITVENLTNGALPKRSLIFAVSLGVGVGITVGVVKVIYDIGLVYLLVPGYGLAMALTAVSSEEFVNVAWDSAGVTTGPVTVPLVLALGLSFGGAVKVVEGFGILTMASIGPIVTVLLVGLWAKFQARRRAAAPLVQPGEAA